VLDTWFSSWLWPISVFDGLTDPENEDIKYYYPTNDLVTAPEILFFWVARMIIAGYEWEGKAPFKNVYLTGIVRDKLGRKMSKSLGNSPDPLMLIEKYSADGIRLGMLLSSPAGNDLPYDDSLPEQGRNFGNKIWNAFRLVQGWNVDSNIEQPEYAKVTIEWYNSLLNRSIKEIDDQFDSFRISEALMQIYKLFWDEFSAWYLELVKPAYGSPIDVKTYEATLEIFDKMLKLLHPFMPFITEEIWHYLAERTDGQSIMMEQMPKAGEYNEALLADVEFTKEVIANLRTIRKEKNIPQKDSLELFYNGEMDASAISLIVKLGNLTAVNETAEKVDGASSFLVKTTEFYVPLGDKLDVEEELKKLNTELDYTRGFLNSVQKKLSNEKFVGSAPEAVVNAERKKEADALSKIVAIEAQIAQLV